MATDFDEYAALPVEEAVWAARSSSRRRQVLDAAVKVMSQTGFHQMLRRSAPNGLGLSVTARRWSIGPKTVPSQRPPVGGK